MHDFVLVAVDEGWGSHELQMRNQTATHLHSNYYQQETMMTDNVVVL